jgi:hypothetical protein
MNGITRLLSEMNEKGFYDSSRHNAGQTAVCMADYHRLECGSIADREPMSHIV